MVWIVGGESEGLFADDGSGSGNVVHGPGARFEVMRFSKVGMATAVLIVTGGGDGGGLKSWACGSNRMPIVVRCMLVHGHRCNSTSGGWTNT